jgi:hypothetical protein
MNDEVSVHVYVGRDKSLFAYCAELHAAARAVAAGVRSVRLCGAASGHVAAAHVAAPAGGVLTQSVDHMLAHAVAELPADACRRTDSRMLASVTYWAFSKGDKPDACVPEGLVVPLVRALLGNVPMSVEDWRAAEWVLMRTCPARARAHLRARLALYCDDPSVHEEAELHRDVVAAAEPAAVPEHVLAAIERIFTVAQAAEAL